ncbi:enolase C-terminal domain-like protein [Nocardiopsis sp. NPDC050513]|uniref:enolase C-terminal domain-like protein n=1 Tax=Nocardiopsis sp. NPDC050513 TaxID=3364338 RepID=UPI0037B0B364
MSDPVITDVRVIDYPQESMPGDDTAFVAVHAGGHTGWYGPVSARCSTLLRKSASRAVGVSVTDHDGPRRRLSAAYGEPEDKALSWAIGALDCAVWDLRGRIAGYPVAHLLSSAEPRQSVPAYFSWLSQELTAFPHDHIRCVQSGGWALTKWGLRSTRLLDPEAEAISLAHAVEQAAESARGRLAVDAVRTWNAELVRAFMNRVDPSALYWLEDPLPHHDLHTYGALSAAGVPLAVGELLRYSSDHQELLTRVRPSALAIDVVGCGGLTQAVRILATACESGIPVYPHGRSLTPALHLAAAFPDTVAAVEYRHQWEPRRQRRYLNPVTPRQGRLSHASVPGLGTAPRS